MGDSGAVGGKILSTVKANQIPTENGQSNFGGVGNYYIDDINGDGFIMVFINDSWYCFYTEDYSSGR